MKSGLLGFWVCGFLLALSFFLFATGSSLRADEASGAAADADCSAWFKDINRDNLIPRYWEELGKSADAGMWHFGAHSVPDVRACNMILRGWIFPAAENGAPEAQFVLAHLIFYGRIVGGERWEDDPLDDFEAAFGWYRKSADQGFPPAIRKLANLYIWVLFDLSDANAANPVEGAEPDQFSAYGRTAKEAQDWFREAAERGIPEGQFGVGLLYAQGWKGKTGPEIPRDTALARKWYKAALEQGYTPAKGALEQLDNPGK